MAAKNNMAVIWQQLLVKMRKKEQQVYSTHTAKLVFEIIDLAIIVCFLNIVRNIDINVKNLYYLRSNNRFQWWESILPLFK